MTFHAIGHHELEEAALEQGVSFRKGDILTVRTGLIKWYNDCTDQDVRDAFFANPRKSCVGVDPTSEAVAWLWNQHFAAVAGDSLAWEAMPYPESRPCELVLEIIFNRPSTLTRSSAFHQHLLGLWGTPIGELWDLEKLSEICAKLSRYSFLLMSIPLNVPGGVASPPNAVAVF